MECHYHPGVPGVAECGICHVFICRPCMDLNKRPGPVRCSDCLLDGVSSEIGKIVGRLTAAIVVAVVVLVVAEVVFGVLFSTLATDILGVLVAYVAGSMVLSFPLGPFLAPWVLVDRLSRLEELRDAEAHIMAVRDGGGIVEPEPPPPGQELQPVAHPRPPAPTKPRPTPKVSPRHRGGARRSPWRP
jgi:hypothetical protein